MKRRANPKKQSVTTAFRQAMFWAIVGALASFAVADQNPVYFVLTLIATLACWFGSVRPARPAPRLVINTVLLLVIAIAGIEMLRVGVGVSAFAVFVALLLIVKLLDLRTARDDAQVLVLCLSIMVAAVLTSNSLLTGLLMLVESVLLLRAFALFQLHNVFSLGVARRARMSTAGRVDMRSMLIATGFLCALIGGAIFVLLPRNIGGQAFGQWGNSRSVSGFSDQVELGRPGLISMSSTPVLDLTVTDRNGMNIGAENNAPIYLRGAVLEVYDQGSWRRSSIMRVPLTERIRLFPAYSTLRPHGYADNSAWDIQCEITMRSVNDGPVYLFTPWRPVEFRVGDRPMRMGFDFSRGLFLKDGMGGSFTFAVRSVNDKFRPLTIEDQPVRTLTRPTQIEPQIHELARDILREGGIDPDPETRPVRDDAAAVQLIERHLRTRYKYTLDAQPVPSGQDATHWFLFERRTGHCEYYASALALMSRSVGIPARVVTGYIASDFNPVTEQYVVRESNAHAWTEAEIAPGQWRTYDGTPPSDFYDIHVPNPGLMRSISRLYESIEFIWGRMVVGYDSDTRERVMGEGIGDFGLMNLADRLLARLAAGRSQLISRAALTAIIVFAASLFMGIILMRYQRIFSTLIQTWRDLVARIGVRLRSGHSAEHATARVEREISHSLAKLGVPRPRWQPLRTHLSTQFEQFDQKPELHGALLRAADWVYEHRFDRDVSIDNTRMRGVIEAIRRSENSSSSRSPNKPRHNPVS